MVLADGGDPSHVVRPAQAGTDRGYRGCPPRVAPPTRISQILVSVLVIQVFTSIGNRSKLDIGLISGSATVYIASLPRIRVNPERCPRLRLSRDRREGLSGAFEAVVRSNLVCPGPLGNRKLQL